MKKFEYCSIQENDFTCPEAALESLGRKGWELVTATSVNSINDDGVTYTEYILFILKREIE